MSDFVKSVEELLASRKHRQSNCPVCCGTGMVCTKCHYGGSTCSSIHPEANPARMCEACVPDHAFGDSKERWMVMQ